ncbi:MAG: hypothetical protein V2I26_09785 [Halieaceae bacterium]|nr:hypothetical protein [Halieaceae bacterium]
MFGSLKEAGALGRIVAELVAEDAEGAGGVGVATGDLGTREPFDEVSAKGFVLAVEGHFGGEKEPGIGVMR